MDKDQKAKFCPAASLLPLKDHQVKVLRYNISASKLYYKFIFSETCRKKDEGEEKKFYVLCSMLNKK
ncbi:MAG: hypothetical protein CVU55_16195 [Deltaproteobacteria bacterium HGW-Deltaproteobacteria-13]|jgi:hypothetical protein|nr:MAG: hypothetical protein CVU55_16195 [Deltaproteobacteria bacterium HGW-Deltaproteobacteria-13]